MKGTNYTFERFFQDKKEEEDSKIKENSRILENSYIQIKDKLDVLLELTKKQYPHFSSHDKKHSEIIIRQVERMLTEEHWKCISVADAWMFLCCAYIHDIGMVVTDTELKKDWDGEKLETKKLISGFR